MSARDLTGAVCIVGTARRTWREPSDDAPEPLGMWEEVARGAVDDVGSHRDVLAALDHLAVVHCQAWAYDDPAARLADRLGRPDVDRTTSIIAGTSHQRLLDAAAERMRRGEISSALVVGAEAGASVRRHAEAGTAPAWSFPSDQPTLSLDMLREWYLPTELAHGVMPAWLTFALLEQARWAARGGLASDRDLLARRLSDLSRIAADDPDAWFPRAWSAEQLRSTAEGNRLVATPYTKRMVAFPDVDMAAANLLVTHEQADAWGVPAEHRVYLRGWGFARDAAHVAARADLAGSPAMRSAQQEALTRAGLDLDEVDAFDLYSCFGSAVAFATDALGLADDDHRPLSLTGGLPFHGGPGSNYMGHSISHAVSAIRSGEVGTAMVTGIGMHMTKHVAAVYAAEPGVPADGPEHAAQVNVPADEVEEPLVADHAAGPAVVRAATVVHARDGSAERVVAICGLPDGRRCYAATDAADAIAVVAADAWVEAPAHLTAADDGTNLLNI
jgi:acetyl-CoA C-acetyltransferase